MAHHPDVLRVQHLRFEIRTVQVNNVAAAVELRAAAAAAAPGTGLSAAAAGAPVTTGPAVASCLCAQSLHCQGFGLVQGPGGQVFGLSRALVVNGLDGALVIAVKQLYGGEAPAVGGEGIKNKGSE